MMLTRFRPVCKTATAHGAGVLAERANQETRNCIPVAGGGGMAAFHFVTPVR
jgi:hypothetical protein